MESAAPFRGSIVVYKEKLWYFQPNGTSCYLFETREAVGNQELRKHAARRSDVRLATAEDIAKYGPLHSDNVPMISPAQHPIVPFTEEERRMMQFMSNMTASVEVAPDAEGEMRAHLVINNTFRVPPPPDGEFRAATTPPRGAFIVLEGIDRAGKTTQARLLTQRLCDAGHTVAAHRFPARASTIGGLLDAYLKQTKQADAHVMHLLFAADRWEQQAAIRADLLAGKTVVCDRYAYSGVVYSVSKGLPLEWCKAADRGELRPDLVLFLDLPPEAASLRQGYGVEIYERLDFQRKIAATYSLLSALDEDWVVVDAREHEDLVHARIYDHHARHCIERVKAENPPLHEDLFIDTA